MAHNGCFRARPRVGRWRGTIRCRDGWLLAELADAIGGIVRVSCRHRLVSQAGRLDDTACRRTFRHPKPSASRARRHGRDTARDRSGSTIHRMHSRRSQGPGRDRCWRHGDPTRLKRAVDTALRIADHTDGARHSVVKTVNVAFGLLGGLHQPTEDVRAGHHRAQAGISRTAGRPGVTTAQRGP